MCYINNVLNSTCIHYVGARSKYMHVHVINYAQPPLNNGKNTKGHIYIQQIILPCSQIYDAYDRIA